MSMEKEETSASQSQEDASEIDLYSFHEQYAGRLIIDPAEAKIELGLALAAQLKLSEDGSRILWPQPTDSALNSQIWTMRRKNLQLLIITFAAIVPDFDSATGIAAVFPLAAQYNTTPGVINDLTARMGWFVCSHVDSTIWPPPYLILVLLALVFLVGCTFAPNLKTFAAMRCLTGFFGTTPQVTGLYVVTDPYPFHLQARKLNIWTFDIIISPFISPFAFGFLVAWTSWRWAYGIASIYSGIVMILNLFFKEETIYDRTLKPIPEPTTTGLRYRIETLIGITGSKMQKYRISWTESILAPLHLVWRPHLFMILTFEAMIFGFGIGMTVTNAVFLGSPPPMGRSNGPET